MPELGYTEESIQAGSGGRVFAILTAPRIAPARPKPLFVLLSAGLLHRVGPVRLHVLLARELASLGYSTLRLDFSGKGDSPIRSGLTNQESVAADFADVLKSIKGRFGGTKLVLAGLCSGADNAVRLGLEEESVVGMVLLDPICYPDSGFEVRARIQKFTNRRRWALWFERRGYRSLFRSRSDNARGSTDPLALRDLPTREQVHDSLAAIDSRGGSVLSIFTSGALGYYNQVGQLKRVMGLQSTTGLRELFWPDATHTFTLQSHRRRLISEIKHWAQTTIGSDTNS